MTLEAIYFISQIVAALGIILSLIFVGIQVRQSTAQGKRAEAASRTAAMRATHENFANWYMHSSKYPHLTRLISKALNDFDTLDDVEVAQYLTSATALVAYAQNAFFEWRDGELPDELWKSWEVALNAFRSSGGQQFWAMRRHMFADSFVEYLETELLKGARTEERFVWGAHKLGEAQSLAEEKAEEAP